MKKIILLFLLSFSFYSFADKMISNIDFTLSQNIDIQDLKIEKCNKVIQDNLKIIPYKFIDIGYNIFESNSENWKAYIECDNNQIMITIHAKKTIDINEEVLTNSTINEKFNKINEVLQKLKFK